MHGRVCEFSQTGKLYCCQQEMTLDVAPSKNCCFFRLEHGNATFSIFIS